MYYYLNREANPMATNTDNSRRRTSPPRKRRRREGVSVLAGTFPEAALLLPLCGELGITVNGLLSGERGSGEN